MQISGVAKSHWSSAQINEVPKFLADSPNEITHAVQLVDPLDAANLLIILLQ